jgi:hypothetical protein
VGFTFTQKYEVKILEYYRAKSVYDSRTTIPIAEFRGILDDKHKLSLIEALKRVKQITNHPSFEYYTSYVPKFNVPDMKLPDLTNIEQKKVYALNYGLDENYNEKDIDSVRNKVGMPPLNDKILRKIYYKNTSKIFQFGGISSTGMTNGWVIFIAPWAWSETWVSFSTLFHEAAHCIKFGHGSGVTYGLSDRLGIFHNIIPKKGYTLHENY